MFRLLSDWCSFRRPVLCCRLQAPFSVDKQAWVLYPFPTHPQQKGKRTAFFQLQVGEAGPHTLDSACPLGLHFLLRAPCLLQIQWPPLASCQEKDPASQQPTFDRAYLRLSFPQQSLPANFLADHLFLWQCTPRHLCIPRSDSYEQLLCKHIQSENADLCLTFQVLDQLAGKRFRQIPLLERAKGSIVPSDGINVIIEDKRFVDYFLHGRLSYVNSWPHNRGGTSRPILPVSAPISCAFSFFGSLILPLKLMSLTVSRFEMSLLLAE